jgi:hypothetical protein
MLLDMGDAWVILPSDADGRGGDQRHIKGREREVHGGTPTDTEWTG